MAVPASPTVARLTRFNGAHAATDPKDPDCRGSSERWRFVAFGDAFGGVGLVEFAFGGDGFGFVVGAGVSAFGHHRGALGGRLKCWWLAGPQRGGGFAQLWEQVLAAGIRGVGVPGW